MVFTRSKDVLEYINNLQEVTLKMSEDFANLAQKFGVTISADEMLKSYYNAAKSPSTLESILIKKGSLTAEEAKRNHLMEFVIKMITTQ